MKKVLTKEQIENVISNKFVNPKNFQWVDGSLVFDCDDEMTQKSTELLMMQLYALQNQNTKLEGKLEQANETVNKLISWEDM